MAIRLSRKGWNNVLMLAVAAFIVIIQFSHQQLFTTQDSHAPLIMEEAVVMDVKVANLHLQRVGNGWRASDQTWSPERIETWIKLWQQPYAVHHQADLPVSNHFVSLHLLAKARADVYFFDAEQQIIYRRDLQQVWQIPSADLKKILEPMTTEVE
ncbi:hypothetical protein [Echinimonas agarilytica]|uniref:Uncharacterized protein n=1 Tax=Echinimonas agarilytica TaxID=1215918 RepID=A0AA42B899_9GAMM|nr:hypothetical protein [Echinimonas agarilytica]MCM2680935.1 hypothetical protein [Echinimonas agarilytica]